jgi:VWFA-related protein
LDVVKESVLAGILAFMMLGNDPQQGIPDAPKPQALPSAGEIAPGKGTTPTSNGDAAPAAEPGSSLSGSAVPPKADDIQGEAPEEGVPAFTLTARVNFVQVPFTVKDSKGVLMPGLGWRDIQVFENGYRQRIAVFTVDPFPLSVALVIDQSLQFQTMTKVNNALGALQGAFTPYDEVAVITYNNGPKEQTKFTAAQSARLAAVLEQSKSTGRDAPMAGSLSGPLTNNINVNSGANSYIDPNTNSSHGTTPFNQQNPPRELHTLNDAILAAGSALSKTAPGRRRVIYVISDGKEYGSKAKFNDVKRYLQQNQIAVWATLVGDSSLPGMGFMSRIRLPLMMRDNILPQYAAATGGQVNAAYRTPAIETSFQKITEEVRTMYTVGYYSREPFLDGKFRTWQVDVLNHGNKLDVIAPPGYYPMATAQTPAQARPPAQGKPQ